MVVTGSSSEEVLEELRKDIYAEEVWDLEKAQVIPVSWFASNFYNLD